MVRYNTLLMPFTDSSLKIGQLGSQHERLPGTSTKTSRRAFLTLALFLNVTRL